MDSEWLAVNEEKQREPATDFVGEFECGCSSEQRLDDVTMTACRATVQSRATQLHIHTPQSTTLRLMLLLLLLLLSDVLACFILTR